MNIFVSYSWADNDLVNKLDLLFNGYNIVLKRDIRDLHYKESIKEFMKKIRDADYCLMIISDSYLKSQNCMYEVLEFVKDDNYIDKILPIICKGTRIFSVEDRAYYIKYWQDEYNRIESIRNEIGLLNQEDIIHNLKMFENIQRNIANFLFQISNLMLIVIDSDLSYTSFLEINSKINIVKIRNTNNEMKIQGYFVANLPRTITDNVFKWWALKDTGYVNDIRNAKIFLQDDIQELFNKYEKPEWNEYEYKKLIAIPVRNVLALESNVIPYVVEYTNVFQKLHEITIGNKKLTLTKEEIENYR